MGKWKASTRVDGQKRCSKCHNWFPEASFHINHQARDSRHWQCKTCQHLRQKLGKFHLTEARYRGLLEDQNGQCAICWAVLDRPYVDHDHTCCPRQGSCGRCVRGILCTRCNIGLGNFGDDPVVLRRAILYLESYNLNVETLQNAGN